MIEKTIEKVERNEVDYQIYSADDFPYFVAGLKIPVAGVPILFDRVMTDFQREDFELVGPALHDLKVGRMPACRRFWMERTKKASKDNDIACMTIWLMAFVERPFLEQICAANSEQAKIVEDRARAILFYNPWLNERVEIIERCIRSKRMPKEVKCQIEATGSAGAAQGPTPDLLVLNELVHVDKWAVMEAHRNNADGVPKGVVIIATNAGIKGGKAWEWRKEAIRADNWRAMIFGGVAPWINETDMAEAKKRDPVGSEYRRLWEGKWISGTGDAVDEAKLDACFTMDGPHLAPVLGFRYVAGLDLGINHDHAGLGVLGVSMEEMKIAVAHVRGWEPILHAASGGKKEVDIESVKQECLVVRQRFNVEWFGYDPAAGGSFAAQDLRKQGVPMVEWLFNASNLTAMATAYVTAVNDGRLECYEDGEGRLRRDFGKFNIKHTPPSNYRLIATSDGSGHADVGTAVVIALPKAMQMLQVVMGRTQKDDVIFQEEEELTPDEVEEMPEELREIYEGEDQMDDEYGGRRREARGRSMFGSDWDDRFGR
jgi:hypothetical protein